MRPRFIGLAGIAGSGKGEVSKILVERGYTELSVSKPMKDFCYKLFKIPQSHLFGASHLRNTKVNGIIPRIALQKLGDCIRDISENALINCLLEESNSIIYAGGHVVVSDIRLAREVEYLKNTPNSEFWFVERPNITRVNDHKTELLDIPKDYFDFVILNNGDLNDLKRKTLERIGIWSTTPD